MQFLLTGHLVTLNIYRLVSFAGFVTARERRLASALGGVFYCGPDTAAAASEWPPGNVQSSCCYAVTRHNMWRIRVFAIVCITIFLF